MTTCGRLPVSSSEERPVVVRQQSRTVALRDSLAHRCVQSLCVDEGPVATAMVLSAGAQARRAEYRRVRAQFRPVGAPMTNASQPKMASAARTLD